MKTLTLLLLIPFILFPQTYPRWFLEQGSVPCAESAVAVDRAPSLHRDTAVAVGFRAACGTLARYSGLSVKGGQAFWNTEAGTYSMGASYRERFDTALASRFAGTLTVIDAYTDRQNTIVLVGNGSTCTMDKELLRRIAVDSVRQPDWVEHLPDSNAFVFGVGTSEEFYYESSSWNRAEENAVRSLARSVRSAVTAVQKKDAVESQELYNEEIDVRLSTVRIMARWRDTRSHIFYVLARSPRP